MWGDEERRLRQSGPDVLGLSAMLRGQAHQGRGHQFTTLGEYLVLGRIKAMGSYSRVWGAGRWQTSSPTRELN